MAKLRKFSSCFIVALALLIILEVTAQIPADSEPPAQEPTQTSAINKIVLDDTQPDTFNCYNTNGTAPYINGKSALFNGANTTNVYSDIVSRTSIRADLSLVLEAQITANVTSFSNTGEDQFAVFATDDTTTYKSNEFGFVLPEIENIWYAYIQSPQIQDFFVWQPISIANPMEPHSFKAVYSDSGLNQMVDFFVDDALIWSTTFPNVSGNGFHLVLTSHKVSAENIDLSQNQMEVRNACLSDWMENSS